MAEFSHASPIRDNRRRVVAANVLREKLCLGSPRSFTSGGTPQLTVQKIPTLGILRIIAGKTRVVQTL